MSTTATSDHVTIAVTDEGPGLTPDQTPNADTTDTPQRTPIGLNLARRLIETDGGRLRTPTGPKPTFEITLPTVEVN